MKVNPEISFVIPARDEEKSISILFSKIQKKMLSLHKSYEVIFIDDGSIDGTFAVMEKLYKTCDNVKVVKLRGGFGKSIALSAGFTKALGKIIITMDADLQDDPDDIPKFIDKINEGYDLVSGWKKKRYDPISKKIPSRIGNFLARILTGVKIHDSNCGFKAYRKEVIEEINLYGELYKYIPALASKFNYRIGEIIINHHPRQYGRSKFGFERNLKGILDLFTVAFLTKYIAKPSHFFGSIGFILFGMGFGIGLYITYLRFSTGTIQYRQPLLFLGILLMVIGIQLITTGLIAEMIASIGQKDPSVKKFILKSLL